MSKTPRTEVNQFYVTGTFLDGSTQTERVVGAAFARELETELNEAKAELEVWRKNKIPVMIEQPDGSMKVHAEIMPEDAYKLQSFNQTATVMELKAELETARTEIRASHAILAEAQAQAAAMREALEGLNNAARYTVLTSEGLTELDTEQGNADKALDTNVGKDLLEKMQRQRELLTKAKAVLTNLANVGEYTYCMKNGAAGTNALTQADSAIAAIEEALK